MVTLDEKTHIYTNIFNNKNYLSVTKLLKRLEHEFALNETASRIASEQGKTTEQVIAEWDAIRNEANEYGKSIHSLVELYLKNPNFIPSEELSYILNEFKALKLIKSPLVHSEKLLYLDDYEVAGTADIIEEHDSWFNVWDIKTNIRKGIEFIGWRKWLKPPVNHLSECNYNTYSLQLSMYGYMAEKLLDKKVGRMGILFLNKSGKFTIYPVPYLKFEAYSILESYKRGNI